MDGNPLNPQAHADINKVLARDHEGVRWTLTFSCFIFSYLKKKCFEWKGYDT